MYRLTAADGQTDRQAAQWHERHVEKPESLTVPFLSIANNVSIGVKAIVFELKRSGFMFFSIHAKETHAGFNTHEWVCFLLCDDTLHLIRKWRCVPLHSQRGFLFFLKQAKITSENVLVRWQKVTYV